LRGRRWSVLKSVGILRYSPKLNGSLERRDGGSTKWWLVIDVDPDLGRYCRQLYHLSTYRSEKINRPVWEAHISVVRDEEPLGEYKPLWERHNGDEIEFDYDLARPEWDDLYIWLPVVCEAALDIRQELGLVRQPAFPLHLTIGNRKCPSYALY
jgi:hypothetical protein